MIFCRQAADLVKVVATLAVHNAVLAGAAVKVISCSNGRVVIVVDTAVLVAVVITVVRKDLDAAMRCSRSIVCGTLTEKDANASHRDNKRSGR